MKRKQVQALKHGLYQVYWKEGGSSLCAVGYLENGDKWIAPTNWVNKDKSSERKVWKAVKHMKILYEERFGE